MPEFQAIFFDFDGVLADTEPVHWATWAEALAPLGVKLDWDFYQAYCIGIDDRDMLRLAAARFDPPRDWEELWTRYPAKKELFRARMIAVPPFVPRLAGFLAGLHESYKLAVVTSSSHSEIDPLLAAGGLRGHFDTVVGAEHVGRRKPFPDPYLLAAERLGVTRALVVEDSEAGVASGRAAGFEVLAVRRPDEVPEAVQTRLGAARV
jgi:HAD superfamily hydrolase (TIGR01509 family)